MKSTSVTRVLMCKILCSHQRQSNNRTIKTHRKTLHRMREYKKNVNNVFTKAV